MPQAATVLAVGHDLVTMARGAVAAVEALLADATAKVRERVAVDGRIVSRTFDREQRATHGLAWLATYVEAVRQLAAYAERMQSTKRLGEIEDCLVRIGLGEYLAQILGGIPMSQGEIVRLSDLGLGASAVASRVTPQVEMLIESGNTALRRARLVELMRNNKTATVGTCGLDDTLEAIREEMRKFADSEVIGDAQGWHRTNSYIPMAVIAQMADLGVFGLTIPEEFGGMGLGKESMCVVSEELSRGYIGSARLAPGRRLRPSLFSAAAPKSRRSNGCPSWRPARSCRPRCSPSRTPAPISPR
jgi:(2S)-methylsuccinyl-CoA dehydrogenase